MSVHHWTYLPEFCRSLSPVADFRFRRRGDLPPLHRLQADEYGGKKKEFSCPGWWQNGFSQNKTSRSVTGSWNSSPA